MIYFLKLLCFSFSTYNSKTFVTTKLNLCMYGELKVIYFSNLVFRQMTDWLTINRNSFWCLHATYPFLCPITVSWLPAELNTILSTGSNRTPSWHCVNEWAKELISLHHTQNWIIPLMVLKPFLRGPPSERNGLQTLYLLKTNSSENQIGIDLLLEWSA